MNLPPRNSIVAHALVSLCAALVAGCSSTPIAFPFEMRKSSHSALLESRAQIVLEQKVEGGPELCERYTDNLRFSARREGDKVDVAFSATCTAKKGFLLLASRPGLNKGKYTFRTNRASLKYFEGDPVLYARYANPDFNSGDNFVPEGAVSLEANQSVKGQVNYNAGNRSDWVRLRGKASQVTLTLMTKEEDPAAKAEVYEYPETAKHPRGIGTLSVGQRRTFKLEEDDIYVRVTATEFKGPIEYSLLRRDTGAAGGKRAKLAVLDSYQVSDTAMVVLLQASQGMKPGDKVSVQAKTYSGKIKSLGRCSVSAVEAGQATCRLDHPYSNDYAEFSAEATGRGLAE